MAFEANQKNPISSDKSKNDFSGKNDSNHLTDSTMQNDSTRKASTSSKPQELGYFHSSTVRDFGNSQGNHYTHNINTSNFTPGTILDNYIFFNIQ